MFKYFRSKLNHKIIIFFRMYALFCEYIIKLKIDLVLLIIVRFFLESHPTFSLRHIWDVQFQNTYYCSGYFLNFVSNSRILCKEFDRKTYPTLKLKRSWELRYATDKKSSIMRLSFEHNFFEALNFEVLQALSLFTKMSLFYHCKEKELLQIDIPFADDEFSCYNKSFYTNLNCNL